MFCKRMAAICIGISVVSIYANRCARLTLHILQDKSYTVTLSSVNDSLFTGLGNTTEQTLSIINSFFPNNNFQTFVYNSQLTINRSLNESEAQGIIKRQAYATQVRHYVTQMFTKTGAVQKAQSILTDALQNFDKTIRTQCVDSYVCDNKSATMDVAIDIDNETLLLAPYVKAMYGAIRSLGQVLGFEIPDIEQAWYMGHKGKVAIGVGTGLALLAVAKYANLLGGKGIHQSTQPQSKPVPIYMESEQISKPWYADPISAAKVQISAFIQVISIKGSKQVSKAVIEKLAIQHGVSQPPASPGMKDVAMDMAAREVIRVLAEAYGGKVSYSDASSVSETLTSPVSILAQSPSLTGNIRSWFESTISSTADTVRSGVTKAILSPQGGGVAKSYKDW